MAFIPVDNAQKIQGEQLVDSQDAPENIYRSNIQIGELNAMNAGFSVIRYKQLRGIYTEDNPYYHLLFDLWDQQKAIKQLINENPT